MDLQSNNIYFVDIKIGIFNGDKVHVVASRGTLSNDITKWNVDERNITKFICGQCKP